ncbi:MAG: PTS transporter subunit EIIB [Collinsella sp.]
MLDNIGGADNVVSAAHCATRLRLVIADNAKVNKEASRISTAPRASLRLRASPDYFWHRHRQQGLRRVHCAQRSRGCHQGRGQGGRGTAAEHLYACH